MKVKFWWKGDVHPSSTVTVEGRLGEGEAAYFMLAFMVKQTEHSDFCCCEIGNKIYTLYIFDQEVHGPPHMVNGYGGRYCEGERLAHILSETFKGRFRFIEN